MSKIFIKITLMCFPASVLFTHGNSPECDYYKHCTKYDRHAVCNEGSCICINGTHRDLASKLLKCIPGKRLLVFLFNSFHEFPRAAFTEHSRHCGATECFSWFFGMFTWWRTATDTSVYELHRLMLRRRIGKNKVCVARHSLHCWGVAARRSGIIKAIAWQFC